MTYTIRIPISEIELQDLSDGREFEWRFISDENEDVAINVNLFMQEEEDIEDVYE